LLWYQGGKKKDIAGGERENRRSFRRKTKERNLKGKKKNTQLSGGGIELSIGFQLKKTFTP